MKVAQAISIVATALLAACATPAQAPLGASEAQVKQQFGTPFAEVPIDGGKRLQYVYPPMAQYGFMVDLDANGRVVRAEQVMDDAHFARLQIGKDTMATVQREFGPPSKVVTYFSTRGDPVWTYKYKQNCLWNMLMGVYFNSAGVVTRLETGPDPDFDKGSNDRSR
jgi:hypothetical protein